MTKVLVVDDHPQIRQDLYEILTEDKYEVVAVGTGEEAIQAVKKGDFDVALVDLIMPGMDGIDTLKGIKKTNPTVRVIMITAYPTIESAVEAMKKGASDYIHKPFLDNDVQVTVAKVVEETRLERQLQHRLENEGLSERPGEVKISLKSNLLKKFISNPIRRGVIAILEKHGKSRFSDIKRELNIKDAPKLSFHLRALKSAMLIKQDHRKAYYLSNDGEKVAKHLELLREDASN